MFLSMKLRTKLLVTGVALTALPLGIMIWAVIYQNGRMTQRAAQECVQLAKADLDHIAKGVYALCTTQNDIVQQNVDNMLNVARCLLTDAGGARFDEKEVVSWEAINQYSKAKSTVKLPKMSVGETWLGQNYDTGTASPLVDEIRDLSKTTCTVFQRMNEAGDMLRVCTNVEKLDGTRAIGTFIPAVNPPGAPDAGQQNPVVSTLLNGETYRGRAFVVNAWYLTAYEPIVDATGKVMGALYVGLPMEGVKSLREAIMNTEVGQTGYVYVIDSNGNYVISKDGARDGECIWETKDADGTLFIQEIIKKALVLKPGELAEQHYPWKNSGETVAREKIVRIVRFEPWDWTIGVGSYLDEFTAAETQVREMGAHTSQFLVLLAIATVAIAIAVWFGIAFRLNRRLQDVASQLQAASDQVASASTHLTQSGQELAAGANEQAAGLEQTSAALEEISGQAKGNAEAAEQATNSVKHVVEVARHSAEGTQKAQGLSEEARQAAEEGANAVEEIAQAMGAIREGSDQITDIIEVINSITHQTKMLATNAAIEAARAGDQGKGFAVVADEVSKLAENSKSSAKEIGELIRETARRAQVGSELAERGTQALKNILNKSLEVAQIITEIARNAEEQSKGVDTVGQLVGSINRASSEQASGVDQVAKATDQMDQVTQRNAANAQESASASEELSAQAMSLQAMVFELVALMEGCRGQRPSLATTAAPKKWSQQASGRSSQDKGDVGNGDDNHRRGTGPARLQGAPRVGAGDLRDF